MPRSAPRFCWSWGWASRRETAQKLELEGVLLKKGAGAADVAGFADHLVVAAGVEVEHILEAGLHQRDGQVGDVYAEPLAVELLGGSHGGATAAEGVENHVALVGRGLDDAFEEGLGFLGGVAEAFAWLGTK